MDKDKVERRAVEFVNTLEIGVIDGFEEEGDGLLRVGLRFEPTALRQVFDEEALKKARADSIVAASAERMAGLWAEWLMDRVPIERDDPVWEEFREAVGREIAARVLGLAAEAIAEAGDEVDEGDGEE